MTLADIEYRTIITTRIAATSYEHASQQVIAWAHDKTPCFVSAANVHVVMEACDNTQFTAALKKADLITPDGVPLVWALKMLGVKNATRVYGPDLTLSVCEAAENESVPIALYGSTPDILADFVSFLNRRYPALNVACSISPPFRRLSDEEDAQYVKQLNDSGARILFVGLGCPKQELWIADHLDKINMVMLAVGVAFDFHAGATLQAPRWIMRLGLEWLFRLMVEPKRLWKRYVRHNPRFVWKFMKQWLRA